jgi:hypothetical protein
MGDLLKPLLAAYLAYLPWLLFAIGLVLVILGTTIGPKNRRATVIGLWATAIASIWLLLIMLKP